ncbi:MAG: hypothetical protein ACJ8FL_05835 [Sphingomicrobium sp.]
MAYKAFLVAAVMIFATPGLAQPAPAVTASAATGAAAGASGGSSAPAKPTRSEATKYCAEVEPPTGSLIKLTECKTRAEWAREGIDVDQLKKN